MSYVPPPTLRPMNLGDLLDGIFRMYRNNFLAYVGAVAMFMIPFGLIFGFLMGYTQFSMLDFQERMSAMPVPAPDADPLQMFSEMLPGDLLMLIGLMLVVGLVQSVLVQPLMYGAMVRVTSQRAHEHDVSMLSAYEYGVGRMASMVVLSLLSMLAMVMLVMVPLAALLVAMIPAIAATETGNGDSAAAGLGLLLLLALLVYLPLVLLLTLALTLKLLLSPQAIVIEGHGVLAGLRRSWSLTRGSFWRVFGIMVLVYLIAMVISMILSVITQIIAGVGGAAAGMSGNFTALAVTQAIVMFLSYVINILIFPIYGIATTLLYYDLRARREGHDLELMSQGIAGMQPPLV